MQSNSFKVLFYLRKAKTNSRGLAPLMCRITLNKQRKEFSTGYFIAESDWDSSKQLIIAKSLELRSINNHLNKLSQLFLQLFNSLLLDNKPFDVNDVYNLYKGNDEKKVVYLKTFYISYLERLHQLVGIDLKLATWKKHENAYLNLESYLLKVHKSKNFKISEIDLKFIKDFEYYLKTNRKLSQATINKILQRLKKMFNHAIEIKQLDSNPFNGYRFNLQKKEIVYLTNDELVAIQNCDPIHPRLKLVKNLFIFCCYTGLAYNEMRNLKRTHIQKGFDGNLWIQLIREKTNKRVSIPLLPKAKQILEIYLSLEDEVFPRISNQKFNLYLKEIAVLAEVDKIITHHTARKTFASTILLYNDVPIELVSELLGHSSIKVTQESYAKLSNRKVSQVMIRLSKVLK